MKTRKSLVKKLLQTPKIQKGFGYFLKLSGNPNMKDVPGDVAPAFKRFLLKNNSNER